MTVTPPSADPRPYCTRAADQMAALIASVRPEQLGRPTPCDEWDVRALLGHVVDATRRFAALGEGGDGTAMRAPAVPEGIPDDGWAKAYGEARADLTAAWSADDLLDGSYALPWGQVPGRVALSGCLLDTVTHTWDLARALEREQPLDEELAAYALAVAEKAVPAERRGGPTPFAAVRSAPEGADAYGRLAAWLGRDAG